MSNPLDLTSQHISDTYQRILQTDGGYFYDGLGNTVSIGVGSIGPQGYQGPRGDLGMYGPQGYQGPRGDLGMYGPQGSQGPGSPSVITNLPIPKINLVKGVRSLQWWDYQNNIVGGFFDLHSYPIVVAQDISQDLLSSYRVFVEMIFYRKKTRYRQAGLAKSKKGYVTPSPWFQTGTITPPNNLPWFPWNTSSRTGNHTKGPALVNADRPNHYEVLNPGDVVNVYEYLNGRFTYDDVFYYDSTGATSSANMLVPVASRAGNATKTKPSRRFGYNSMNSPYYFAFRYILWDPSANNSTGQVISGPLSRVIKMTYTRNPFIENVLSSSINQYCCVDFLPGNLAYNMNCWFETRLP